MAKSLRAKLVIKLLTAATIIYAGINSITPIRYAVSYSPRRGEPSVTRIEQVIQDKKVPPKQLDGVVFLKLHEDFFEGSFTEFKLRPKILFIPDGDRYNPHFYLDGSFTAGVCHEVGHSAYANLPREMKVKWESYVLRLLDANFRCLQDASEVNKVRQSAFDRRDINSVRLLDHQMILLYSYSILPADFDDDYKLVINLRKLKKSFDPEELFAQGYEEYLTGESDKSHSMREELRTQLGIEKPELEYLTEEGIRLIGEIIRNDESTTHQHIRLLNPRTDFFEIWLRHLNPISTPTVLETMLNERAYGRRLNNLCLDYESRGVIVEK